MLSGTADVSTLAVGAPTVTAWATEPLSWGGVDLLSVAHEVWGEARQAALPPGLHPCTPATVVWSFLGVRDSELGPFGLCLLRSVCRSGVRGRGYLVGGFASSAPVAAALREGWGLRVGVADVVVERGYAGTWGRVVVGGSGSGEGALEVGLVGPEPIAPDDLQYTATMSLAHTPLGLRLVQVELDYAVHQAERGRPVLRVFRPEAWGQPLLRPSTPVSASVASADVRVLPVRYVCSPDAPAFGTTERVG